MRQEKVTFLLVVNYGSTVMIRELLATVPEQVVLIVVDNFSSESELTEIRSLVSGRHLASLVESSNGGYAAGLNQGLRLVNYGSNVVIANPDTVFCAGAFQSLIDVLNSDQIDLVSPVILQSGVSGEDRIWFAGGHVSPYSWLVTHRDYGRLFTRTTGLAPTSFVSGCVMAMNQAAVDALFPMDESFFMYYEDVLMSIQAQKAGIRMGICYGAVVIHDEGATSRGRSAGRSRLYYYYQGRNRLLAARRSGKRYSIFAILFSPWVVAKTSARVMRKEDGRVGKVSSLFLGMLDGLTGRSGKASRKM